MDKASRGARRTLPSHRSLVLAPPQLVRSRSGSAPAIAMTAIERSSRRTLSSSSKRFIRSNNRSKSTSSRSLRTPQSSSGATSSPGMMKKVPSAWAMSPGRSSLASRFVPKASESPEKANGGGGGRRRLSVASKVLSYWKQRKASVIEEEGYHRFKILHNRLLQWRFINARAHFAMTRIKTVVEMQLFSLWFQALQIRKMILKKRIELQNVRHLIKLYQIVIAQDSFLDEWAKLEIRNQEPYGGLERKLLALSTTMPLSHDLKANTVSVQEALNTVIEVINLVEPLIMRFQTQVERILYLVKELITTSKQEEQYLQDLMEVVPMVTTLMEKEKSIQVCLISFGKNGDQYWH